MKIDEMIHRAIEYHQSGNLDKAESIYKIILQIQPNNINALYSLGEISFQSKRYESSIQYINKVINLSPTDANAYNNLGIVLQEKGSLDEAIMYYQKAILLNPSLSDSYNNMGLALQKKGELEEAITYYQKAIQVDRNQTMAYFNMGNALKEKGLYDEAVHYYQKVLQVTPHFYDAYNKLGDVFREIKQLETAIKCYQQVLSLNPNESSAYENIGICYFYKNNLDEAIRFYQKALEIEPNNSSVYNNLGLAFQEKVQFDNSIQCYQKALSLNPNLAKSYYNLGSVYQEKGQLDEADLNYRLAIQIEPDNVLFSEIRLFSMLYNSKHDAQTLFDEHLRFANKFTKPLSLFAFSSLNECIDTRRLKIGYVSPDFRRHSVAYFIEPVLVHHNKENVQIFCYSNNLVEDEVTKRIREHSATWRKIIGMTDDEVAKLIRKDNINILIDLAGHTAGNRILLFARKPAPIQVDWIGYPSTTGLSSIDYKIVDSYTDPPGMTEQFYTEKLIRMPKSFLCYLPERDSPEVGPLPALANGHVTFGSFNNFAKISPEVLHSWKSILKRVPNAQLIIKAKSLANTSLQNVLKKIFTDEGIDAERIRLFPWIQSSKEHLDIYNLVDIALDTFPYNGTTTTCEALWMGVPVITLSGKTHASRIGLSLLSNINLTELIASSYDEYIDISVNLSSDIKKLRKLRESLHSMISNSPLMNAQHFTFHLEQCYLQMWKTWCESV